MNPPANWYEDPTGRHGQRYWDGEQWTEHVFTDGVQGVDPLDAGPGGDGGDAATDAGPDGTDDDAAGSSAAEGAEGVDAGAEATDQEPQVADEEPQPAEASRATTEDGDETHASQPQHDEDEDAGDTTAPAPLPRRGAHVRPASEQSADTPVEGLFTDTTAQEASAAVEPAGAMWTPDEAPQQDDDDDADVDDAEVAPEVEAADVVASLDEVSDTGGQQASDATDSHQGDEASGFGGSPVGDLSDAFVLAPETASRLVGRRHAQSEQADQADETDETDQAAPPAEEEDGTPPVEEEQAADEHHAAPTGAIDAPPPSMPPRASDSDTTGGGLGITGDLVSGAFAERADGGPVSLQNSRLLRCAVGDDAGVVARQGTMVAYQGQVSFERQGAGGVTRALKRAATGEGLAMMRVEGSGDVFFADGAQHVFVLQLDGGPGLSVNGRNILAFSADLQWDIQRVKGATLLAGGLFNTTLTGTGWVALISDGEPVVLRTDEAPTHVDVNALVAWSAGLSNRIVNTASAKSLVGLGSGEAFQMAFDGSGVVIVQPSEGPMGGATPS